MENAILTVRVSANRAKQAKKPCRFTVCMGESSKTAEAMPETVAVYTENVCRVLTWYAIKVTYQRAAGVNQESRLNRLYQEAAAGVHSDFQLYADMLTEEAEKAGENTHGMEIIEHTKRKTAWGQYELCEPYYTMEETEYNRELSAAKISGKAAIIPDYYDLVTAGFEAYSMLWNAGQIQSWADIWNYRKAALTFINRAIRAERRSAAEADYFNKHCLLIDDSGEEEETLLLATVDKFEKLNRQTIIDAIAAAVCADMPRVDAAKLIDCLTLSEAGYTTREAAEKLNMGQTQVVRYLTYARRIAETSPAVFDALHTLLIG